VRGRPGAVGRQQEGSDGKTIRRRRGRGGRRGEGQRRGRTDPQGISSRGGRRTAQRSAPAQAGPVRNRRPRPSQGSHAASKVETRGENAPAQGANQGLGSATDRGGGTEGGNKAGRTRAADRMLLRAGSCPRGRRGRQNEQREQPRPAAQASDRGPRGGSAAPGRPGRGGSREQRTKRTVATLAQRRTAKARRAMCQQGHPAPGPELACRTPPKREGSEYSPGRPGSQAEVREHAGWSKPAA